MGSLVKIPVGELIATLERLDAKGVRPEHFHSIRSNGLLAELVAKVLIDGGLDEVAKVDRYYTHPEVIKRTVEAWEVLVKPDLEEAIWAGEYEQWNKKISTRKFPLLPEEEKEKTVEIELICLHKAVLKGQVFNALNEQNCRPATVRELLALASQFSDLQMMYRIVALGSVYEFLSERFVVYVGRNDLNKRIVDLVDFDDLWHADDRFAVVRKTTTSGT